jgi:hypothetical protein
MLTKDPKVIESIFLKQLESMSDEAVRNVARGLGMDVSSDDEVVRGSLVEANYGLISRKNIASAKSYADFDQWGKARELYASKGSKALSQWLFRLGFGDKARADIVADVMAGKEPVGT